MSNFRRSHVFCEMHENTLLVLVLDDDDSDGPCVYLTIGGQEKESTGELEEVYADVGFRIEQAEELVEWLTKALIDVRGVGGDEPKA